MHSYLDYDELVRVWKLDENGDVVWLEFDDEVVTDESVALFDDVFDDVDVVEPEFCCTSAVVEPLFAVVAAVVPVCCEASAVKVATPMKLIPISVLRSDLMRRVSISRWVGPTCGETLRSAWYQSGICGRFGVAIGFVFFLSALSRSERRIQPVIHQNPYRLGGTPASTELIGIGRSGTAITVSGRER